MKKKKKMHCILENGFEKKKKKKKKILKIYYNETLFFKFLDIQKLFLQFHFLLLLEILSFFFSPHSISIYIQIFIIKKKNNCIKNTYFFSHNKKKMKSDKKIKLVQALWDYEGEKIQNNLLTFKRGDIIKIIKYNETNWWTGQLNGKVGFLPANYTREYLDPSEIKKSVTTIIKTVFKQEANLGLKALKEQNKINISLAKRNSLPHVQKLELKSDFSHHDFKKLTNARTVPISFAKKNIKKSILSSKREELQRSFSDPNINANDPSQVQWKKTEVEETVSVLNDVKSDDGRLVFRIKQKGDQLSISFSF